MEVELLRPVAVGEPRFGSASFADRHLGRCIWLAGGLTEIPSEERKNRG